MDSELSYQYVTYRSMVHCEMYHLVLKTCMIGQNTDRAGHFGTVGTFVGTPGHV